MTFKKFITDLLKPYIGKEVKITVKSLMYDTSTRMYESKDIVHVGTYKSLSSEQGFDTMHGKIYDDIKIRLITREGKTEIISIDMDTNIEFN